MSGLEAALADYLAVRRALGFKLRHHERLLGQFIDYLEARGERVVTVAYALAWATLPAGRSSGWLADRLTVVRGFAVYLHTLDPAHQVPPRDLLPARRCRLTPYLYSDHELDVLLSATRTLRSPYRQATYRALIGLLAVTGMRVGEAIALDREDFDPDRGFLVVASGKFGKSRELPLHPTTVDALLGYLQRPDRPQAATAALLISGSGGRLPYYEIQKTFRQLAQRAGLTPRSANCWPRLCDFRHGFAVQTILDAYRDGVEVEPRLSLLSTYLGHVDPKSTYWYLSGAPELLTVAARRLERHLDGQP